MADADLIADRRRLRRKLSFWRIVAFLVVVGALVGTGLALRGEGRLGGGPQVARIALKGFIAGDADTLKLFDKVRDDQRVKAVLLQIESPGGTTSGAEAIYEGIRKMQEKKPVVAVVNGTAASGAYIAALATDHIVARETSLVGSIGVLFQYPNVGGLLNHVGVKMEEVKSSPLKAAPNGYSDTSPEARAALEALVADTYAWFKNLVKDRRGMTDQELAAVSDGRVFTGRQAMPLKLVDELGGERQARAWLAEARKVSDDLPARDWKPDNSSPGFTLWSAASALAELMGQSEAAAHFRALGGAGGTANLDGLLALWHPSR